MSDDPSDEVGEEEDGSEPGCAPEGDIGEYGEENGRLREQDESADHLRRVWNVALHARSGDLVVGEVRHGVKVVNRER
jgi:hypothetical protein